MSIQKRKDTYVAVPEHLEEAYARFLQKKPIRVIPGDYETVGGEQGNELPGRELPDAINTGIMIHHDALNVLNDDFPLSNQLLAETKGEFKTWQLRPKAPRNEVEKKFDAFLKALAEKWGCSIESLKQQGFNCESKGDKGTSVNFPSKDLADLFSQMLTENISAHQLLSDKRNTPEREDASSSMAMCF